MRFPSRRAALAISLVLLALLVLLRRSVDDPPEPEFTPEWDRLAEEGEFEEAVAAVEAATLSATPGRDQNAFLSAQARIQGDWGQHLQENGAAGDALDHYSQALKLSVRAGDRDGEVNALRNISSFLSENSAKQRQADAFLAQARAIARKTHPPSLTRFVRALVTRSLEWLFRGVAILPQETLPLLLLLGGISAIAARLTGAPTGRWLVGGAGLGIATFVGCTVGIGWLTGELGNPGSVSWGSSARLLAFAIAGGATWVVTRVAADVERLGAPGVSGRLPKVILRFGIATVATVLLLDLAFVGLSVVDWHDTCPQTFLCSTLL